MPPVSSIPRDARSTVDDNDGVVKDRAKVCVAR